MENFENNNETKPINTVLVVVCICAILLFVFIGFFTYQNFKTQPIYVDPIEEDVQVANINKDFNDLVYRGEEVEIKHPVYKGEKIEFTYLK